MECTENNKTISKEKLLKKCKKIWLLGNKT